MLQSTIDRLMRTIYIACMHSEMKEAVAALWGNQSLRDRKYDDTAESYDAQNSMPIISQRPAWRGTPPMALDPSHLDSARDNTDGKPSAVLSPKRNII